MKSVQAAGRVVEGATAPPGRAERWGVWGAPGAPHEISTGGRPRGRGRHGSAGARRALGGLGGARSPPSNQYRWQAAWSRAPRLRRGAPSAGGFGGRPEPPMKSVQRRLQPLDRLALVLLVRLVREPGVIEEDPLRRGERRRVRPTRGVPQPRAP